MSYIPDTMRKRIYDKDNNQKIDIDAIPTITRDKLEYPTEDVPFIYLIAIGKIAFTRCGITYTIHTVDQFADKAIDYIQTLNGYIPASARCADPSTFSTNKYIAYVDTGQSSADFMLKKYYNGYTTLATESVDLDEQAYLIRLSCSGSTIKAFRDDLSTPKLSVTDTDIPSGYFGVHGFRMSYYPYSDPYATYLRPPSTQLPQAKAIVEVDIIGSGTEDDPYRPNLAQELVEVSKSDVDPETWIAIQDNPRGKNGLPLIDKASVMYGVFDHKPQNNTVLVVITSGNTFTGEKAIQKQIEHAKRTIKPPGDYSEAVELHRQLKPDFDWIAGKDNFAYQTLGHPDLEAFQVADTYYGNVIDGIKPDAYKKIPSFEMYKTLAMWKDRLKRATVVKSEAEKHLKKLEEVEKKGW